MTSSGLMTGLKGESGKGEYCGSITRKGKFGTGIVYSVLPTGLKDALEAGESVRSIRADECTSESASGFASGVT